MTDDELKSLFDSLRGENSTMRRENTAAFDSMRRENAAAHVETRRHFEVTAEGLKQEIRVVAEAVVQLDQKVGRETQRLEEKMDRGFAETQAMIKFSHAELDRRLRAVENGHRTLEETVAGLQARLERLESTTH
ncbi:MAG TPA: hypothetical protein VMS98_20490 [Thermoanaerobaculia bacterium]|nr:hypothetical protein [Thermoanaerobaculia bacterium]